MLEVARGNKGRKNRKAVVVWGDKAGAAWHDALEEARVHALPAIFVCEAGNGRQASRALPPNQKLRPGEELPTITVDGHDVVAAYRVAHESIDRARRDRGPTLILLATFEIKGRVFADAVADMERYLEGGGGREDSEQGHRTIRQE